MAISSPLLEDVSIDGATGILINITGGPDLTLHEVNEASTLIQDAAHEDANIIFGSVIDPNLSDEVRITVIATGFDRAVKTQMIVEPPPVGLERQAQGSPDHAAVRRVDPDHQGVPGTAAAPHSGQGAGRPDGRRAGHRRSRWRGDEAGDALGASNPPKASCRRAWPRARARRHRSTARRSSSPSASARSRGRA